MKNLGAERLAGHRAVTAAELIRMPKSDWLRITSTAPRAPHPGDQLRMRIVLA